MEKKKSFKKTALREWFSSYLMMLIIPLFFFVIFVFSSIGIISKEVEYYNSKSVEYVSKLFDSMFQQMNSLCDEIIVNANLKDFIQIKKVEDINPYDLHIASDSFLSIALPKNQLELVFLYSPDLDYYIDPYRFGTLNSISDYSEGNLQYDYDDIDRVFRSKNRKTEIYDASYENASGTRINRILITRPLSFASRDGFYVAAIVKIDTIIGKEEGYDAFRRLMLFSSVDSSFIYDLSGANEEEHPSSLEDLMDGKQKNEIIASRKSNVSNFIYAIKIDKKEYFRPIYLIYVLIAVYLVVAILFGFLTMGSKVRRNWKTLSEALARSGGGTFDGNADSIYSPFVSSVNRLSEEKQGLELILHSQTESLKKSMFDKILNSSENASLVSQNALKECGIDFLSDSFIIFLASSSDIEKAEEAVIERFSCDDIKVFPYGSHYGAAFILSLSSRYAKDQNSVYNDISAKARSMIEHCIVDDCCASSIINGIANLGNGYLDALNTMEYKHSNRIAEFLFYRDVLSISQNIKYSYCAEDGIDLINAIFEGRADDAIEIIRKVIKTNQSSGVSPRHMRYLLFSISNTVLKAYTKLEEQYGEEIGTFTLPAILQAKNIEVARIALEERVNVLSEYAVSLRNTPANADEGHYKAYRRALEIIETEYSDPVLNVSSIADKLGISIALLSKIFKKYHNMNISDYISRYRVEASKKLLLSCMPLNEIAEKCGFGSLRTYMRVFKKLEDVSPGVFRTINKEEF